MDCKLIAFPLVRRIGKIRRVAEVLESRHGAEAAGYWRVQVRHLAEGMQQCGYSEDRIAEEVRAFHDAVQREMMRIASARKGETA
ncbi:DUF6074 family protein [Neorhizobium sp. DT-125]|uniref:DUF6074 family protein n=1 Tax=Neorhizobium sp. DT-125 TaxID=3396163 RepID=UPI003F1A348D